MKSPVLFFLVFSLLIGQASATNVSYYNLDDNVNDSVSGYNGTIIGTVTYVSGISGNGTKTAYSATGANRINFGAGRWDNLTNLTINISFKTDGLNTSARGIFSHYINDTNRFVVWIGGGTNLTNVRYSLAGINTNCVFPSDAKLVWHNLSISLGTTGFRVIDNGTTICTNSSMTNSFDDLGVSVSNELHAYNYSTGYLSSFSGNIDELSILNDSQTFQSSNNIEQSISYNSTFTSVIGLKTNIKYNNSKTSMPILVMMTGYSGTSNDIEADADDFAFNISYNPYFVIIPDMRGRNGSGGTRDTNGYELFDIIDAVEHIKNNESYSQYIDKNNTFFYGISGGAGNGYTLISRFPTYFNASSNYFGISDYAAWHGENAAYQAQLETDIGGTPAQFQKRYSVRSLNSSIHNAYNNLKIPMLAFHGSSDTTVYPHHTSDVDNATSNPNQTFNIWANITHGYGQTATRSRVDIFFNSQKSNTQPSLLNTNLTILGYLNTSGVEIKIYNSTTGTIFEDVAYVTIDTQIINSNSYYLRYNNGSIVDTQTANNGIVRFNTTKLGGFNITASSATDLKNPSVAVGVAAMGIAVSIAVYTMYRRRGRPPMMFISGLL